MTVTNDKYWSPVGALELEIDHAECERLSAPGGPGPAGEDDRITALLSLHGGEHTGLGEEIGLMEPPDYDTFAELARTLAVDDFERALSFYRALGFESERVIATEYTGDETHPSRSIAMIQLERGDRSDPAALCLDALDDRSRRLDQMCSRPWLFEQCGLPHEVETSGGAARL